MSVNGSSPLAVALPVLRAMQINAIPLGERSKVPCIERWPELATTDQAVHDQWIRDFPTANVGAALGLEPCNVTVFVVDLDLLAGGGNGGQSLDTYRAARELDPLPATHTVRTGGGGVQLYFYAGAELHVPNKVGVLEGVDVRGDGGQCVFPPSIHPDTGHPYEVLNNLPIAEAPTWLLELVGAYPRGTKPPRSSGGADPAVDGPPILEHTRDDTLISIAGTLRRLGIAEEGILGHLYAVNEARCQPPKELEAIQRIAHSAANYEPDVSVDAMAEMLAWTARQSVDVAPAVLERAAVLHTDVQARDLLAAMELQRVRGDQPRRSAREFVQVPQAPAVIDSVLAAEVNLLGGPQEAGKSLLARDWAISVASGMPWRDRFSPTYRRPVVVVASEGLHDFAERWQSQPHWDEAADAIFVEDQAVNLVTGGDVDWLLDRYADVRPGLVVFDVIYGMGMADDNGFRDVLPVLASMKRISAAWGAATLALGHPGHNEERRLRGSSMWRQLAYTEWHLSDGYLTCEKSKLADRRKLGGRYAAEYPRLRWLDAMEAVVDEAGRWAAVQQDLEEHPESSDRERARRLSPVLGVSEKTIRRLVKAVRDASPAGSETGRAGS